MARALSEYAVSGVTTTIPFFQWILRDPDFLAGRFDTTFLDRVLAARDGQPFQAASGDLEDLAAVAAALHTYLRRRTAPTDAGSSPSAWTQAARAEGRRS